MIYTFDKENIDELLNKLQDDDIVEIHGRDLISILRDKGTGGKGRKAIQVDQALFNETVARWQCGEISARQAMEVLGLKPNTFYRRIKQLKESSPEKLAEIREDIDKLKTRVYEDTAGIRQTASNITEVIDTEREIRLDRIGAKINHTEEMIAIKRQVKKETKKYKGKNK